MNQAVDDVRRVLAGFRLAGAGVDGDHAATETRRLGVDEVDALAAASLCQSVGHKPLVTPAGFERGGGARYLLDPCSGGSGYGRCAGSPAADQLNRAGFVGGSNS